MVQQALPSMFDVSVHVEAVAPRAFVRRQKVPREVIRDSQSRSHNTGRPGSRRYQRFLNKSFLQEQIWDLQVEDFSIKVPTSLSPFTCLFESANNMERWSPFVEVTEEIQCQLLSGLRRKRMRTDQIQLESKTEVFIKTEIETGSAEFDDFVMVDSEFDDFEEIGGSTVHIKMEPDQFMPQLVEVQKEIQLQPAPRLFQNIEKRIRRVIQKDFTNPILVSLENQIIEFIESNSKQSLNIKLEDSFHRMICYGICQFYSLKTKSLQGKNIVVVNKPKRVIYPSVSLAEFLATYSEE
eukprot:TRINITY_DN53_c0_g1_i1.p1 TRINITY_DN53_c0_g1~~TRINITY_DN53_c0_g1_i1.p1  ORF type:complete len:295 (+),score=74.96 TRINITY_DN53_c0_g1_i1:191-1075(+)